MKFQIFKLPIVIFLIGTIIIVNSNSFALNRFSSQLFEMDLPSDISVVDTFKTRGNLNGNGNTMDFFACIIVKTNRTQDEVQKILDMYKFKPAKKHNSVDKEVVKMENNVLETKYVEHEQIVFDSIKNKFRYDNYYAMIIYDGGYSSDFDILGH